MSSDQQSPDERFVAERLRAAAHSREARSDAAAVLRSGYALRRRRRYARTGLALSAVVGIALGAVQLNEPRVGPVRDIAVAAPPAARTGPFPAMDGGGCAYQYNAQTLAQRNFAFDGTVRAIHETRKANARYYAVDFDVHRWFVGGSGSSYTTGFSSPDNGMDVSVPNEALEGEEVGPSYGIGTRFLVGGEHDYAKNKTFVWSCGFTRYWTAQDAAVWDRAFSQVLGSSAARSSLWCVSDSEANPYGGRWSDGPEAVEAARQASQVLDEQYGSNTGTNRRQLRAGVLGVAGDEKTREMVVVVDPSRVAIAALQTRLNRGRDETKNPAPVVVRAGCRSAEDLERFGALLDRRDWHPDARNLDVEYFLGASQSMWIVDMSQATCPAGDPDCSALAAELRRQLGNFGLVRNFRPHF